MLSSTYFRYRWSWYRPILSRGESPAGRARVDVRRLPLRFTGEDAVERIPYAVKSEVARTLSGALRRLQDHTVRYVVEGEKVSAHQLPQTTAMSRAMIRHLRELYPHLPAHLLHHWCAEERGGLALVDLWQRLWAQAWKQDQADGAPWVAAVNVLLMRLMREAIGRLPDEHPDQTDHVVQCVVGGLYLWALQGFLKRHVEGEVEVTRIATYESMIVPATPMAFFYRQTEPALLADDRHIISAYGLEPDLVPRMREYRRKLGPKNEAGMLALLGESRLGDHMLKRSWARLCLWEMAEKSGNGAWMQWVLDPKKLDHLLIKTAEEAGPLEKPLRELSDHPFAAWLLAQLEGGRAARRAGRPWVQDKRTLMAFRVFDEDVAVERARREAEQLWFDRAPEVIGKAREAEADKLLEGAYKSGEIVLLQMDTDRALHGGGSLAGRQACLRLDWSDYLAGASLMLEDNTAAFLEERFLPGVFSALESVKGVYLDACSGGGCLLRGTPSALLEAGLALRSRLRERWNEILEAGGKGEMPPVPACLALNGRWSMGRSRHGDFGEHRVSFARGLTHADAGVGHDAALGELIAAQERRLDKEPLGSVRVESLDSGAGKVVQMIHNSGFALTAPALSELTAALRNRAEIREYRPSPAEVQSVLGDFRLPAGQFDLITVREKGSEGPPLLIVRVGTPCLAGDDVAVYELLDPASGAARRILDEGLAAWGNH